MGAKKTTSKKKAPKPKPKKYLAISGESFQIRFVDSIRELDSEFDIDERNALDALMVDGDKKDLAFDFVTDDGCDAGTFFLEVKDGKIVSVPLQVEQRYVFERRHK